MKNHKGQAAIWIIIAILFVSAVLLFFNLNKLIGVGTTSNQEFNANDYVERCVKNHVENAVSIMLPQGGFLNPENYVFYENNKVTYLCQNLGNYRPCINQHPMLLNEMKGEIINYSKESVEECFIQLEDEMRSRNMEVESEPLKMDVGFGFNRININIDKKITSVKDGEVQKYEEFNADVMSPFYDISLVAMEIASQEAKYCYFEYVGYMIMHPEFLITKKIVGDDTKIYTIKHKDSGKEMNIAIKGCSIPRGI